MSSQHSCCTSSSHPILQCCNFFLLQQLLLKVNCATRRVCLLTVWEASQIFHLSANHEHLSDGKGQSGSCSQAVQLHNGKAGACCLLELAGGEPHPKVFGLAPYNHHPMVNLHFGSCVCGSSLRDVCFWQWCWHPTWQMKIWWIYYGWKTVGKMHTSETGSTKLDPVSSAGVSKQD